MLSKILKLFKNPHVHLWEVVKYEKTYGPYYRRVHFRFCKCGKLQEHFHGRWGEVVNRDSVRDALNNLSEMNLEMKHTMEDFARLRKEFEAMKNGW